MADNESKDWDSILAKRLARETGRIPADQPASPDEKSKETNLADLTALAGQTAGDATEFGAEGDVMPASDSTPPVAPRQQPAMPVMPPVPPQQRPTAPPDQPLSPPGPTPTAAGLTQGWPAAAVAPPSVGTGGITQGWVPTDSQQPSQGSGGLTQGWPAGVPQPGGAGGLTQGWPSAAVPALGGKAGMGRPGLKPPDKSNTWTTRKQDTSPSMLVEQLRNLSAKDEKRAFDILRGAGANSRKAIIIGVSAVAAIVASGAAFYFAGFFQPERELRLAGDVSPPDEAQRPPAAAGPRPGPLRSEPTPLEPKTAPTSVVGSGASARRGGGETTVPPRPAPAPLSDKQRLTVNDGPTFAVPRVVKQTKWVRTVGPPVDLSNAPSCTTERAAP